MAELEPQSKRQRLQEEKVLDEVEFIMPSDTELVIKSIQPSAQSLHGITFLHQFYATMRNRSIVDEEILCLRTQKRSIKCLQCSLKQSGAQKNNIGENSSCLAIISTSEYIASISTYLRKAGRLTGSDAAIVGESFARWVARSTQISTSRQDLLSGNLDAAGIEALIHAGFLTYRNNLEVSNYALGSSGGPSAFSSADSGADQEFYWLAHPSLRSLSVCLLDAEKEIVAQIKKTRYKEISEKKLQAMCAVNPASAAAAAAAAPTSAAAVAGSGSSASGAAAAAKRGAGKGLLKTSAFPLSYHLLDLEGRGVIYKVAAPASNDIILRLKS